jgi:hypothetical protein
MSARRPRMLCSIALPIKARRFLGCGGSKLSTACGLRSGESALTWPSETRRAQLARLPITVDPDTDQYAWTTTLQLADRFGLTPYDAAYLELAQRRTLPLATLDEPLRAAAPAVGVQLLGTSP